MTDTTIVGLTKAIEDNQTGNTLRHHVIVAYQVNLQQKTTIATLAAYGKAGAPQVTNWLSMTAAGVPPICDVVQWLYGQILATDTPENVLFGATPVVEAAA